VAGGLLLETDACSGPFFAGRDAVVSGGVVSPAFVGVVAGVCASPDFGMTVFFILLAGMSGLYSLLSWATARNFLYPLLYPSRLSEVAALKAANERIAPAKT
jgi:hypothetical protein